MHFLTVEERWNYFKEVYLGNNNRNIVFDIIPETLRSKKGNTTLNII